MPQGRSPILELHGITKAFGGVEALRGVDFALSAGEIHGLVGENGAGKSTLMKIIAGVHAEFSGRFVLDGRETRFRSVRDARAAGIAMVHQELSVVPDLSVAENVFLGAQPTNRFGIVQWRRMAREAREQLARFGIDADPLSRLGDLPIGLQQLIEIARVLSSGARIIILDEPTSALSPPEVERLFATLRRLRDEGTGIVFISHFIEDILRVSDTVTVFRNGRKVADTPAAATSKGALIEAMIGKGGETLEESYTDDIALPPPSDRPVVLKANRLSLARSLQDVSFQVRSGEVLGIYGFMGCGQLELARILFGKLAPDQRHGCRRRRRKGLRQHGRCAGGPASPSLPRAAAPCCSSRSRSTRTSRSASSIAFHRCFSSRRASARSPRGRSSSCRSGRRPSNSSSACCPAATSRRSRLRSG